MRFYDKRYELLEGGQACVANMKTDKDLILWAQERTLDCYIGRANKHYGLPESKWHNPIKTNCRDFDAETYIRYLKEHPVGIRLSKDIHELKGKLLICWCFPERCHGEILCEMANRL